jgi:hypothetical protein
MSISTSNAWPAWPRAASARVESGQLRVKLTDGREINVPLDSFAWLADATEDQRHDLEIIEGGAGIWWEPLDDGLSVPSLLGLPEYPPPDPAVRAYVVAYRHQDDAWTVELRGTTFSTYGRTLALAKRRARELLCGYLAVDDLGAAGIEVIDEVHSLSSMKS